MKWTSILKFIGTGLAMKKAMERKTKIDCKKNPCWYYFALTGDLKKIQPASDGKDSFFLQNNSSPSGYIPIDLYNSDLGLLIRIVYCEARSETYKCKLAVAEVIRNRVKSSEFKNTLKDVIYEPNQFGCINHPSFLHYEQFINKPKEKESFLTAIVVSIKVLYQNSKIYPENLLFFRPDNKKPSPKAVAYNIDCVNNFWTL